MTIELNDLSREEKLKLANQLLDEVYGEFDSSPAGESAEKLLTARLKEFDDGETSAITFEEFRKKRADDLD